MQYQVRLLGDRAIDELIGLSQGIVADGIVNQKEAEFLLEWMVTNVADASDRITNQLYRRIQEMLVDGILDDDEQKELLSLLKLYSGDEMAEEAGTARANTLLLDEPPPQVEFPCMAFCLTGKFAYAPRKICQQVIEERGGKTKGTVSALVDYLVIGSIGNPQWIHSKYGRKIEAAATLREQDGNIKIISEDHWANAAFSMAQ